MKSELRHRGPDDDGTFRAPGVAFGFVRLSLVDLSPAGHQPMRSPDGRYTIIYNGEVYNHAELRDDLSGHGVQFASKTDTEVVLHAYAKWGIDCLHRLNGMFAFAIHDSIERSVLLVRDRFGVKPLYYCRFGAYFVFASEIKAILSVLPSDQVAPDDQIMFDYLAFDRIDHTEKTFFRKVRKLAPGHYLRVPGGASPQRWYSLRDGVHGAFSSAEEYRASFASSVRYALRGDVQVGERS